MVDVLTKNFSVMNIKSNPKYIYDHFEHCFDYEVMAGHLIKYICKKYNFKSMPIDKISSIKTTLSLIDEYMIIQIKNNIKDDDFIGLVYYISLNFDTSIESDVKQWCICYIKRFL